LKHERHELPAHVHIIPLLADSPKLNPTQAFGDVVKDRIANVLWGTLEAIEADVAAELKPEFENAKRMRRLVSNSWLLDQVNVSAGGNNALPLLNAWRKRQQHPVESHDAKAKAVSAASNVARPLEKG
jgi:hypothetical protein